jgi:hypothetical protein
MQCVTQALQQFSQRHRVAATAAEKHTVPGLFGELISPFPCGISFTAHRPWRAFTNRL